MNYYLDTEFDGFGGALLSIALVREDDKSLYLLYAGVPVKDPWVQKNVVPILRELPYGETISNCGHFGGASRIAQFLCDDPSPHIHADWPDDVRYFCQAIITGPGQMVAIPHITFEIHRVDAYPTTLPGAVQHNAWWDAMALKYALTKEKSCNLKS